jgi:YVTN family beta-propeller protein
MTIHKRTVIALLLCGAAGTSCRGGGESVEPPGGNPPPAGAHLEFVADTVSLNTGQQAQVRAVLVDAQGQQVPNAPITYSIASGNAASISSDGVVNGIKAGPSDVRASTGSLNASATVEVFGHPEGQLIGSTPLGARPFGVAVSRTGLVYVTQLDAATVTRLDTTSLAAGGAIAVGDVPTGVTFSPRGDVAYVTNQWSQSVGVIDVAGSRQQSAITLPADPFVPFVSPDGAKLFITSNTNSVFVASTTTRAITDVVQLTQAPNGFALHPDQKRIYVSASFGGTVHEIDLASNAILRTFTPGGTPQGLVVSKDGNELLVANEAGWIDVYSLSSGLSVAKVTLAGGGFGTALSPDEQHLYVSLPNAGKVQVVNIPSRKIIHTIDVGGRPRRIAFTRHGGVAVIPNEAGYVSFVR